MKKIAIIYWSGTGNTARMAELVKEGIGTNAEVSLKQVSDATIEDFTSADIVALGCSSMGDEVLEEMEFEPYNASILPLAKNKQIGLFGSYGWGDGQWMRDWVEQMRAAGATLLDDGLIVNEDPKGEDIEQCKQWGVDLTKW